MVFYEDGDAWAAQAQISTWNTPDWDRYTHRYLHPNDRRKRWITWSPTLTAWSKVFYCTKKTLLICGALMPGRNRPCFAQQLAGRVGGWNQRKCSEGQDQRMNYNKNLQRVQLKPRGNYSQGWLGKNLTFILVMRCNCLFPNEPRLDQREQVRRQMCPNAQLRINRGWECRLCRKMSCTFSSSLQAKEMAKQMLKVPITRLYLTILKVRMSLLGLKDKG